MAATQRSSPEAPRGSGSPSRGEIAYGTAEQTARAAHEAFDTIFERMNGG